MAIQPIDLQTLYTQLDKVSKTVAFEQQGVHLKNALNDADTEKRIFEKNKAVQQASMEDSETSRVKERKEGNQDNGTSEEHHSKESNDKNNNEVVETASKTNIINDPELGRYVDISG